MGHCLLCRTFTLQRAPSYIEQISLHQLLPLTAMVKKVWLLQANLLVIPLTMSKKKLLLVVSGGNFTLFEHLISDNLHLSHFVHGSLLTFLPFYLLSYSHISALSSVTS